MQEPATRYVWWVIFLLTAVNACNYMDRMALSVLLPLIKSDLHLSDGQLGLLVGLAFSVFYAICGLPIARWADRGTRRDIIALALVVWSAMTALSGAAQNYWHLFLARVGVGAGEAGCLPPAQSLLCDYVPLSRRSGVFAIHNFGLIAGMMLGMALAGFLGSQIGWRWTFAALGLPGILLALLVRFGLREPVRERLNPAVAEPSQPSFGDTVAELARCRTYRLLMVFLVLNGLVQYGSNQWWPSFYARTFELDLSAVGAYLGTAIAAGAGIGLLIGGTLANKVAQRDVRLPLLVGAAASGLSFPAALGALFVPSLQGSILLIALTSAFWSVATGPVIAAVYSVSLPVMRATAGAITIFFTSVIGFGMGPWFVGLLSDILQPTFGVQSLRYALCAPACLVPLVGWALWSAAKQLPNDLSPRGEPPLIALARGESAT